MMSLAEALSLTSEARVVTVASPPYRIVHSHKQTPNGRTVSDFSLSGRPPTGSEAQGLLKNKTKAQDP